jgi:hypothetical protein
MTPKLTVSILSSEAPFNGATLGISRLLPGIDFSFQDIPVGNASIQALTGEDANFNLCHVEPARVLGCVVKLYAAQEFVGGSLTQYVIKALPEMCVEVIHNQVNAACIGIRSGEQFIDELSTPIEY